MPDTSTMEILHRDDLPLGGFAGLREHRLVQDSQVWGRHRNAHAAEGLGNFVYLADARFLPHGETRMHPHHEIDVISVMVQGRIAHQGSLGEGEEIAAPNVQVQRAGAEGFEHNEINPDDVENRMLQLWVLPETPGQAAGYQVFHPTAGERTRIYGAGGTDTFESQTTVDVALLHTGQTIEVSGQFLAYLSQGEGEANGVAVRDGDLLRGEGMVFTALSDVQLTIVQAEA